MSLSTAKMERATPNISSAHTGADPLRRRFIGQGVTFTSDTEKPPAEMAGGLARTRT